MMMPQMDGSDLVRQLQKINPLVKIIAVSGAMSNVQVEVATGTSINAFLSKPYTIAELLKTLHSVLNNWINFSEFTSKFTEALI